MPAQEPRGAMATGRWGTFNDARSHARAQGREQRVLQQQWLNLVAVLTNDSAKPAPQKRHNSTPPSIRVL
jgi:hypothetical protein